MMIGSRMPNGPMPTVWISVAMPQANRSALISIAIWSLGRCSAPPTISGTATALAYMTRTCCRPEREQFGQRQDFVDGMDGLGHR